MSKVYFKAIDSYSKTEEINKWSKELLKTVIEKENIPLQKFVPLKVHFGEKGNKTFIEPKNYMGIIDYLKSKGTECAFIETNALYKGQRNTVEKHKKTAIDHGFTMLPLIFADGEHGESFEEVEIDKKNFKTCKVGKEIANKKQVIVLSHFKGHALAGFGGAIKQLGMGCASRGGKLAQHCNSKPIVNILKCKSCGACAAKCPANAITVKRWAKIDKDKCIGCASCMAICPNNAIFSNWISSITSSFGERLAEYAYAAALNKDNIYITFAFNITKNCDCEGHGMIPIARDTGIFASTDPVAIDQACIDVINKVNKKTIFLRGVNTLKYAEKIGLGSRKYELIEL